MRRLRVTLAAAALAATAHATAPARPVTVNLLAINDLHGRIEPPPGAEGLYRGAPVGGIDRLATHLRRAGLGRSDTLLIGGGDMMGGSPFLSAYFDETPTIAALNALPLAVTSIGNHELDDGAAGFRRRLAGQRKAAIRCVRPRYTYLAANLRVDGKPLLAASAIRRINGVRIGFIGATLADTLNMLTPSATRGLIVLDPAEAVNAAAHRLEQQGVHATVLLIHEGLRSNPSSGVETDPDGCTNPSGDLLATLARLSPSIKVVVSAHTHNAYICRINGRLVTSGDAFGRMFTRLTLSVDRASGRILDAQARNSIVTHDLPADPAERRIVARYRGPAERVTSRIVGSATALISRTKDGAGASPAGALMADAFLAAGPDRADLAFMNSGGIRADLVADAAGKVSYGAVYALAPFGNRLSTVTMTGATLRRLLEQQFVRESPNILQVSTGFTYSYRRDAPAGEHVVRGSMRLDGRPIAPDQRLRVRISDFLAGGGEGLSAFKEVTDAVAGPLDRDALIQYLGARSPVSPPPLDRITRTDPSTLPAEQER